MRAQALGQIVILNGTPRAGKSSIARAMQDTFDDVWINLGGDRYKAATPARYQPGIGLRPGGERPDLEPLVAVMFRALYEAIAAHSRLGLNIVADLGHHDHYSKPLGILPACARQLSGLPVLFVGVRCPLEVVMQRRAATWGESPAANGAVAAHVALFQHAVHMPGIYDLEIDTSVESPENCAALIRRRLEAGTPNTAFARLAELGRTTETPAGDS